MSKGSQVYEKEIRGTLSNGGAPGIATIEAEGDFFWLLESPARIEIKATGGSFLPYEQDTGDDFEKVGPFKRLELKNATPNDVRVLVYVGFSRYKSARAAVIEPRTSLVAWNGTQIGAAAGVTFAGVPSVGQLRRKAIQITNGDASLRLQLRDTAGNVALEIFPETNITQPVSESVEVYNPNGAPVSCRVSEIYWLAATA